MPESLTERDKLAARVLQDFENHDCKTFARDHWPGGRGTKRKITEAN